tara:strand:- start:991 stop:1542 length:552 start_codon:yes stop_codon:yes gene_type:complete
MKAITITEVFDSDVNSYLSMFLNDDYYKYIVEQDDAMIDYKLIDKRKIDDNIYETKQKTIKNIASDLNEELKYVLITFLGLDELTIQDIDSDVKINFKKKSIEMTFTSKLLTLSKCKLTSKQTFVDLPDNKCRRKMKFTAKCQMPMVGDTLEEFICEDISNASKDIDKLTNQWLINNCKDLSE